MSAGCVAAMRTSADGTLFLVKASFQQYSFISFMQKCLKTHFQTLPCVFAKQYGVQTMNSHIPTQYLHYNQFMEVKVWKVLYHCSVHVYDQLKVKLISPAV